MDGKKEAEKKYFITVSLLSEESQAVVVVFISRDDFR